MEYIRFTSLALAFSITALVTIAQQQGHPISMFLKFKNVVRAETQKTHPIELVLDLENDTIGPLDLLFYSAFIINKGEKKYLIREPWNDRANYKYFGNKPILEYQTKNNTWQTMVHSDFMGLDMEYDIGQEVWIDPGKKLRSWQIDYHPSWRDSTGLILPFIEAGVYKIRAYYPMYYYEGDKKIEIELYSKPVPLTVKDYEGIDYKAYQWAMTKRVPPFMFLGTLYYRSRIGRLKKQEKEEVYRSVKREAEELIEKFPGSRLAKWGTYFWARFYVSLDPDKKESRKQRMKRALSLVKNIKTDDVHLKKKIASCINYYEQLTK